MKYIFRSGDADGNRRHSPLGVALVFLCGLSSVIAPPAVEAWGKKKTGKTVTAAPSKKQISAAAAKLMKKARALREKGKNEQAIETYKRVLQIDSAYAEAYLELADIYIDINIPESAAEMLQTGLSLAEQYAYDPAELAAAWCQTAELHMRLGSLDLASGDLVRATTLAPEDAQPHKIAGDIHAAKRRFDDAFRAYDEAVRLNSRYADAWFAMGTLALETKRAKEAQAAYNGLLETDTDRAQQFAGLMQQSHLKPVVTPKASREKIAATQVDDPYAGIDAKTPLPAAARTQAKPVASASQPVNRVASPPKRISAPESAQNTPLSDSLVQAMVDRLFDEDPALADKAREEIALYAEQTFPIVRERLSEPDPERRMRLVRVLGGMKTIADQVMPVLEETLFDPDPGVQAVVEEAMNELGEK